MKKRLKEELQDLNAFCGHIEKILRDPSKDDLAAE
jgi:hypothetical protein